MELAERKRLVSRHTAEVVTEDELDALLERDNPSVYIGYAPTGEMHIGHFTTIRKLADFLNAGLDVTVLVADLHAHLDDEKSPFDLLEARAIYYQRAIEAMINASGADPDDVTFHRGTEYELDQPFTLDLYRMMADTTISRVQRAGSEVVRQADNPKLGGLVYPLMQTLDVAALDVDIAYGGIDQRGIYMLSREILPDHGFDKPLCIFAPLLSGLSGGKMSSSETGSKVNLTDDPDTVEEKLQGAYCPMGEVDGNGVLEYCRYLVFPILTENDASFVVERPEKYGGDLDYETYDALEADFVSEELHPADLKTATADHISDIIDPVRSVFEAEPDVLHDAYPETYRDA